MSVSSVQDVSVKSVRVIRRTLVKTANVNEMAGQGPIAGSADGKITAVIDEEYDLGLANDRRDLFNKMVEEVYNSSDNCDCNIIDGLMTELQNTINAFKDAFPF